MATNPDAATEERMSDPCSYCHRDISEPVGTCIHWLHHATRDLIECQEARQERAALRLDVERLRDKLRAIQKEIDDGDPQEASHYVGIFVIEQIIRSELGEL